MKQVVDYVVASHGYSQRQACEVTRQHRSTQRKPSTRDPRTEVRQRMHEIVATRIRYGYRRVHVMLKREGCPIRFRQSHHSKDVFQEQPRKIRVAGR